MYAPIYFIALNSALKKNCTLKKYVLRRSALLHNELNSWFGRYVYKSGYFRQHPRCKMHRSLYEQFTALQNWNNWRKWETCNAYINGTIQSPLRHAGIPLSQNHHWVDPRKQNTASRQKQQRDGGTNLTYTWKTGYP